MARREQRHGADRRDPFWRLCWRLCWWLARTGFLRGYEGGLYRDMRWQWAFWAAGEGDIRGRCRCSAEQRTSASHAREASA